MDLAARAGPARARDRAPGLAGSTARWPPRSARGWAPGARCAPSWETSRSWTTRRAAGRQQVPDAHLVVVNDSGGELQGPLEHGGLGLDERYTAAVERFFEPAPAGVAQLCAAYSVEHVRVDTVEDLTAALAEPRAAESSRYRCPGRPGGMLTRPRGRRSVVAQEHLAGG
ncbi:hypothetical protein QJS66_19785 [Kocuria rhizophila]|nr:hypothetical protein QJS66_19785 [Kocuria rhizophila]